MFHSKPDIIEQRLALAKKELSVKMGLAAVHRANEVDMSAIVVSAETKSDLHSYLVSEVKRNIVTSHELVCKYVVEAADGEKSHTDQLDNAYMEEAHNLYIHKVGLTMETFFDENDTELEIRIHNLLTLIKDLQRQVVDAMDMRASLKALDWRKSSSGSMQAASPDYTSSANYGASSSNYQAPNIG